MSYKKASALSPRDLELIRNFLVGGAALGGGVGLTTSLANHLKTLKSEQDDSSKDDDTIYINLPGRQPAAAPNTKYAVLGGGLALTGGVLATLGSYALVRKAYQAMKRKRMQDELDAAQNGYLGTVATEGETSKLAAAGKPMGAVEWATSLPIALPILLGLGSGALANKFLDESFPARRKRLTTTPKRVVLRTNTPEEKQEEQDEADQIDKYANAGAEMLVNLAIAKKEASVELKDMVAAAAQGRCAEMELALVNSGADTLFDLVKGASETPVEKPFAIIATAYLCKSAMLSPIVKQLAAAEFADMAPDMFKKASEMDEETSDALAGITCVLSEAIRAEELAPWVRDPDMAKVAAVAPSSDSEDILVRRFLDNNSKPEDNMSVDSSEVSTAGNENNPQPNKPQVIAADAAASKFKDQNLDLIDQVLGGNHDDLTPIPPV